MKKCIFAFSICVALLSTGSVGNAETFTVWVCTEYDTGPRPIIDDPRSYVWKYFGTIPVVSPKNGSINKQEKSNIGIFDFDESRDALVVSNGTSEVIYFYREDDNTFKHRVNESWVNTYTGQEFIDFKIRILNRGRILLKYLEFDENNIFVGMTWYRLERVRGNCLSGHYQQKRWFFP